MMGANQSKPRNDRHVPEYSRVSATHSNRAPHPNDYAAGRGGHREENGRGYADDFYPASRGGPPPRYADDYNQPGRGRPPPYAEDYNPYSAGRGRSPYAGNPYMGGRGCEGNGCAMADGNCTDDLYYCGDDYYDDDDDYYDDDDDYYDHDYYPPGPGHCLGGQSYPGSQGYPGVQGYYPPAGPGGYRSAGPGFYPPVSDREEYGRSHPVDYYPAGRGREDHGAQPPRREMPRPAGGKKKLSVDQGRRAFVRRK